ncbi:MAG: hypothetical protein DRI86_15930 [Bacteroidetes bacterium]|nr:MAG: hypothetical protein DRI86_15930 [Bacteroidota bacterium]
MKFILVFIFCMFIVNVVYGQDEVVKNGYQEFYYSDGSIASEGTMRDGKPDGYWITYNKNGSLKSEGNRKDFELDSLWSFYTSKGKIKFTVCYKNGKKNGYRRTYLPDRILVDSFLNNVKNNTSFILYNDSSIASKTIFVNGLEEGWSYNYAKDGRIIGKTLYSHGFIKKREVMNAYDYDGNKHGVWKYFYDNGNTELVGRYRNGIEEGYFKYYNKEGSLDSIKKYHKGLIVLETPELDKYEIKTDYYSNGNTKVIGSYKDDIAEGVRREYDIDGEITASFIMHKGAIIASGIIDNSGKKQGEWIFYYYNGNIESKGEYINDKRVSLWTYYFENGAIEQTGSYDSEGFFVGEWKWFYIDGNKRIVEYYYEGELEGQYYEFNPIGNVMIEGVYVNGLREGDWVVTVNKYIEKGSYLENVKDGVWRYYYTQDSIYYEGNFIDGSPDGEHIWYYRNGQAEKKGKYVMGIKDGTWRYYNELGKMILRIKYDYGVEIEYDAVKLIGLESEEKTE